MRRVLSAAILVASVLAVHQLRAEPPGQSTSGRSPAFRSGVDLISLNVTVTDCTRRFVTNLEQKDFLILEDGRPQAVTFFAQTGLPLDIAIVIDTSASMQGALDVAQEAAAGFIQRLGPEDRPPSSISTRESAFSSPSPRTRRPWSAPCVRPFRTD